MDSPNNLDSQFSDKRDHWSGAFEVQKSRCSSNSDTTWLQTRVNTKLRLALGELAFNCKIITSAEEALGL